MNDTTKPFQSNDRGFEVDRNKEANEIIIKHNRKAGEDRDLDAGDRQTRIPGSKLDSEFLNLFAK